LEEKPGLTIVLPPPALLVEVLAFAQVLFF